MKLFALMLGFGGVIAPTFAAEPTAAVPVAGVGADTVVLLHGMGRTRISMAPLARALQREGYRVVNLTYPSRKLSLEALATEWLPERLRSIAASREEALVARTAPQRERRPVARPGRETAPPRVHIVTHSMGGILVRLWLRECGTPANLGRVVMLAPPNAGSELTDRLAAFGPYRWFTGVNGGRLGTGAGELPRTLGSWPAAGSDVGVIAGSGSINPFLGRWVPRPNDGKVSVASTHLAGQRDHVVLPFSHTWLAWRAETAAQVSAFLRTGKFVKRVSAGRER